MPTPKQDETRAGFMGRCMSDKSEAGKDFPNREQRYAFCNAQWDRRVRLTEQETRRVQVADPLATLASMERHEGMSGALYVEDPELPEGDLLLVGPPEEDGTELVYGRVQAGEVSGPHRDVMDLPMTAVWALPTPELKAFRDAHSFQFVPLRLVERYEEPRKVGE